MSIEPDREIRGRHRSGKQISLQHLAAERFEWVLPGHGRPWRAASAAAAREEVLALARAMRATDRSARG